MGLQRIKWGSGRFWNPTDFLNQQRKDPLDFFDKRLGVAMLKLHLPLEAQGWNIYGIVDFEDVSTMAKEMVGWMTEVKQRNTTVTNLLSEMDTLVG